jgi:hypothetical protein
VTLSDDSGRVNDLGRGRDGQGLYAATLVKPAGTRSGPEREPASAGRRIVIDWAGRSTHSAAPRQASQPVQRGTCTPAWTTASICPQANSPCAAAGTRSAPARASTSHCPKASPHTLHVTSADEAVVLQTHEGSDFLNFSRAVACRPASPRPDLATLNFEAMNAVVGQTGQPVLGPPMSADEAQVILAQRKAAVRRLVGPNSARATLAQEHLQPTSIAGPGSADQSAARHVGAPPRSDS